MSYVVFDGAGIKEIRCMCCCKEPIMVRKVINVSGKDILVMWKNSSYRTKTINIMHNDRPSAITAMLCPNCIDNYNEVIVIQNAIEAKKEEMRSEGRSEKEIESYINNQYNLKSEGV